MTPWLGKLHTRHVHSRRVRRLAQLIAPLLPLRGTVLDIGCGDGALGSLLRTNVRQVCGIDVLLRKDAAIEVKPFDGMKIPLADGGVDSALLIDVLHHATDPSALLTDTARVSPRSIIIKDHLLHGVLSGSTLRLMDRVGNARHGVALPYQYLTPQQWRDLFQRVRLRETFRTERLNLYPFPATLWFDRGLHFLVRLEAQ